MQLQTGMNNSQHLCRKSRNFALFNNIVCYGILLCYSLYLGKKYFPNACVRLTTYCRTSQMVYLENESAIDKMYFSLSMFMLMLVVLMILVNHKFRSKSKPKFDTIQLWLMVHGVVFYFVLIFFTVPSLFLIKSKYTELLSAVLTGMILAYEIYVVRCFYDEERGNSDTCPPDRVNCGAEQFSCGEAEPSASPAKTFNPTLALVPYFLWIFLVFRHRMFLIGGVPNSSISV